MTQQGDTPPRKRGKKTIEDIKPEWLIISDENGKKQRVEMLSITDAAVYTGYSPTGFYKFLARHPEIKKFAKGHDESRVRFVKKADLDKAMEAHEVELEEE